MKWVSFFLNCKRFSRVNLHLNNVKELLQWGSLGDHYMSLLAGDQYTELLDMCFIMLEGARGTGRCEEELWVMIVKSTSFLVFCLEKLKDLNIPIIFNLETMKLSLELVFDTNNRSPHIPSLYPSFTRRIGVHAMGEVFKLVAMLFQAPDLMMTHEMKCMLHQFVKRDVRLG